MNIHIFLESAAIVFLDDFFEAEYRKQEIHTTNVRRILGQEFRHEMMKVASNASPRGADNFETTQERGLRNAHVRRDFPRRGLLYTDNAAAPNLNKPPYRDRIPILSEACGRISKRPQLTKETRHLKVRLC